MADKEIINIDENIDATRSKISNYWPDKLSECENRITDAKDQHVGNIKLAVQRNTNIFLMIFVKSHLPITLLKIVSGHVPTF